MQHQKVLVQLHWNQMEKQLLQKRLFEILLNETHQNHIDYTRKGAKN